MTNVLNKLAQARTFIKASKIKKDGTNEFSKYDYFTPEYVNKLVTDACIETNTICVFNLKKDEFGHFGELTFFDFDSSESLVTITRTEKPEIKATNETQQMGGMNTYCKRYALMSLFDIEDNTIDFDAHDNRPKQATIQQNQDDARPWLNKADKQGNLTKEWLQVVEALKTKKRTIEQVEKAYKLSKANKSELLTIN